MTLEMMGVPTHEYTPLVVKQSVPGYGRSDKKDVRDMVLGTGMARGAGISYDRLEDLVARLQRA